MNEEEDIAMSIIRMEKLLTNIMSKLEELTEEHDFHDSPILQKFIDLIEVFKNYVISRMKRTPEVERMHIINLNDCRAKIAETSLELEVLQGISKDINSKSEISLKDIVTCINEEEEIIKNIKETSETEIPREIERSMREMLIVKEQEEARKKLLQSKIDSAERRLYDTVELNSATEKNLFDKCAKVEREYADLFAKYDRDIGMSHALLEKLLEDNKIIKAETKIMEDQLAVQRETYIQYKKEREIALMKIFTENLEFFRRNRAAKIIQRAWRAYFQRIFLKKRRKTRRK